MGNTMKSDLQSRKVEPNEISINREYYWDIVNRSRMGQYLTEVELDFIKQSVIESRGTKDILDIGGGSGRFAIPLYKMGLNPTVLEKDSIPLKKLIEKKEDMPCVLADAHLLPFKNNTFDCILAIEVMEEVNNKESFLQECHRVLRTGGQFIVVHSNRNSYKYITHKIRSCWQYYYQFSLSGLESKLRSRGLIAKKKLGLNWLPFERGSNSMFIPIFEAIERLFNLSSFPSISPWVFVASVKLDTPITRA